MRRRFQDVLDELVLEIEAIEKIRLREDRVLHILERGVLVQQFLDRILADFSHDEEIHPVVFTHEHTGEDQELESGQAFEFCQEGTLPLHCLSENIPKIGEELEARIHAEVLLPVFRTGLHESDALQILELPADRVDLFIEQTGELPDEVFLIRVEEECGEKLHSRLRTKKRFQNVVHCSQMVFIISLESKKVTQ